MLNALPEMFGRAVLDRVTLLINHVLSAEPAAMQKLQPHAGRALDVVWEQWPALLPPPPALSWTVTPAGLLELADAGAADAEGGLRVALSFRDLPGWLASSLQAGERPPMAIRGDAQFAADINWLADNLRWDIEDDLARLLGDVSAHQLMRVLRGAGALLRGLAGRRGD
ncbi:MAG TPA: hypothetical protein VFV25_04550 [Methylibium sp.]